MSTNIASRALLPGILAASLVISGCGVWWLPRAHKIEIQQGNILPLESISQVEKGMTRREVKLILGEPVVSSLFNADRWDYIFSLNRSGDAPDSKRLTVFFDDDRVSKLESSGFEEPGQDS
ncbi:hypothetical protein AB833_19655 [Chromatiales bacterium (ex Bugula neritina AB1)]|nr:hypothetical protein AB833_19655 [Chromatiales bacterium (ex Bugula neritina AB1)]